MKFTNAIPFVASLVSAAAVSQSASPLDVKLELVGNTGIKASITNSGETAVKVLKTGSILDEGPVEKVSVFQGSNKVDFDGVKLQLQYSNLPEEAFVTINAGQTLSTSFDAAILHDLSAGGAFDIVSEGAWATASLNSTELDSFVPFSSNLLSSVSVDGAMAAAAHTEFLDRRTAVQSDCTGSRRTTVVNAISGCRSLARTAASQAQTNAAKMVEYFKSSSQSTRNTVTTVFNNVASECGSTTSGVSDLYCTDVYGACSAGVIAYTLPSASYMAYCNIFFTRLPAASRVCHAQDEQSTIVHEATHLRQVKGTSDYNGYGYDYVQSLTAAQNLNHADTYALFAQSFYAGC